MKATESTPRQDNYSRLNQNKEETRTAVNSYLKSPAGVTNFDEEAQGKLEAAQKSASELISGDSVGAKVSYSDIIVLLETRRDALHHITRGYQDHADGTQDLIRDGSHAIATEKGRSESLAVQYINSVQAAEILLDLAVERGEITETQLMEHRRQLRTGVQELVNNLEKGFSTTQLKQANYQLLEGLKGIKKADGAPLFSDHKALTKDLEYAKEFAQFDTPHYHVSTISRVKDKDNQDRYVVESEVMQLGLSPKLRTQFEKIRDIREGKTDVDWFDQLDPVKQGLIRRYAGVIIEGKHVIPTQLIDLVPGMRNAYEKVTSVSRGTGAELALDVVAESKHSGTPTFHGKGDRLQASMDTVEQMQGFVVEGNGLGLTSLNSSGDLFSTDPAIIKLSEKVASRMGGSGVSLVITPMNSRRVISKDTSNERYNQALAEVAKVADHAKLPAVADFLRNGNSLFNKRAKKAQRELDEASKDGTLSPKIIADLRTAVEAKQSILRKPNIFQRVSKLIRSAFKGRPEANENLELAARMGLIGYSMNRGNLSQHIQKENITGVDLSKIPEYVPYCKSGKDRTGLLEFRSSNIAVARNLGIDPDSEMGRAIASRMAAAAHTATMSSFQGGSRGCYGILTSNERHIPREYPELLTDVAANFNKIKVEEATREGKSSVFTEAEKPLSRRSSAEVSVGDPIGRTRSGAFSIGTNDILDGIEGIRHKGYERRSTADPVEEGNSRRRSSGFTEGKTSRLRDRLEGADVHGEVSPTVAVVSARPRTTRPAKGK
jgi:hypothetical protein